MIDIHCHILHGLDDGAMHMEEAMKMVHLASESGVRQIIATPHFLGKEESLNLLPQILSCLHILNRQIKEEGFDMILHPGAEILCTPQTPDLARQGKLPTLGNSRYILTEFAPDDSFAYMELILDQLTRWGYRPVVAHPEIYQEVQKRPQQMQRWFAKGYALQLDKGSILGAKGTRTETVATDLLKRKLVHLIGSNAHHGDFRTTHMAAIAAWGREYLGQKYTDLLLRHNPQRVLNGESLLIETEES